MKENKLSPQEVLNFYVKELEEVSGYFATKRAKKSGDVGEAEKFLWKFWKDFSNARETQRRALGGKVKKTKKELPCKL